MLKFCPFEKVFQSLKLVTITDCDGLETLDLDGKFIDDAPSDDLLACDPGTSFRIVCLAEKQLQVQKVAETAALEDLNLDTREEGYILQRCLLRNILESTDKAT